MSSTLVWQLVRKNSSFIRKTSGVQFSVEKGNVAKLNSYKCSGLTGAKAVDVVGIPGGVQVSLKNTKAEGASKPVKPYKTVQLKKNRRKSIRVAAKMVDEYRPDLTANVRSKVSALTRTQPVQTPTTRTAAASQ